MSEDLGRELKELIIESLDLEDVRLESDASEQSPRSEVITKYQKQLDVAAGESITLTAMSHRDTNGTQTYDFGTIPGADGPYVTSGTGDPVVDNAVITIPSTATTSTGKACRPSFCCGGGFSVLQGRARLVCAATAVATDT